MVFDAIFKFFFNVLFIFLSPLNDIDDIHLSIYFVETIIDCFKVATYVIPVSRLLPIISMILVIYAWRAVIAILKTIWDIIPFT